MGCGSSQPENLPPAKPMNLQSYVIERHPHDENLDGRHYRRVASIQRHLNKAPIIHPEVKTKKNSKRYPKKYNNRETVPGSQAQYKLFQVDTALTLYEFPAKSFPYDQQNSQGKTKNKTREESREIKGHTRTITDRQKNIKGVVYHPRGMEKSFARAQEIYS